MNSLSQRLQAWRNDRGLSQAELAVRAGMPRPNLIAIELGRRDCTVRTLTRLANALGITPGRLLDQSPRRTLQPLNRFERDALARSIITGTPPPSLKHHRTAVDLGPLFRPSLEAAGLRPSGKNHGFVRRRKYRLEALYSPEFIRDVTERVRRLLPSFTKEGGME